MKKALYLCLTAAALCGCSLIPHKVEYFQAKVKPVPAVTRTAEEHQRQAADYVAVKTEQVEQAAIKEGSSTNVVIPAAEAKGAAEALTESLGPPAKPWSGSSTNLVQTLHKDQAKLNAKLEAYRAAVLPNVGKKIEGTGALEFGYFTNMLLIIVGPILLVAIVWGGLKIYGTMNPAVGLGVNTVGRVASSVLSKGMAEVVAGGERFKAYLQNSHLGEDAKKLVDDLFTRAHQEAQSQDVQKIVTTLTKQTGAESPTSTPVTLIPATAASPAAQVNISTPAASGSQVTVSAGGAQVTINQTAQVAAAVAPSTAVSTPETVVIPAGTPEAVAASPAPTKLKSAYPLT